MSDEGRSLGIDIQMKDRFRNKKIWRIVVISIILFVCGFSIVWYGMSSYLCKLIDEGKTEQAITMIDRMSTKHINSYSAPLFMLPINVRMFERGLDLPLTNACEKGNLEIVAALLKKGADPNKFLEGGFSPIEAAFARQVEQRYEIAKLLIEYGADVNLHGSQSSAIIMEAGRFRFDENDEKITYRNVKLLLDNGADPIEGIIALHYATYGNKTAALKKINRKLFSRDQFP